MCFFLYKIFTKNFLSWVHKNLILRIVKVQINIYRLFKYFLNTERITKSKYQNQTIVGFRQLKFLVYKTPWFDSTIRMIQC